MILLVFSWISVKNMCFRWIYRQVKKYKINSVDQININEYATRTTKDLIHLSLNKHSEYYPYQLHLLKFMLDLNVIVEFSTEICM